MRDIIELVPMRALLLAIAPVVVLAGCDDYGYEFQATVNFTSDARVSFKGDRLDLGDTVVKHYGSYEEAHYDVLILNVAWPTGQTTVGMSPWDSTNWSDTTVMGAPPPTCCALVLEINPAQTPISRFVAGGCGC